MNKEETIAYLKNNVRNIPDFPIKGIQFKDITPLFQKHKTFQLLTDALVEEYKNRGITKVVGLESRGFIMAPVLALKLNAGFVPIRKPGKLPAETINESYIKEYGEDVLEIHKDALDENDIILLHDDLLATGGTMRAAYNLVTKMNVKKVYVNFIIELEALKGRNYFEEKCIDISSLIKFEI